MDRSPSSVPQHSTAVRTAGSAALDLLLPAAAGERAELAGVAGARRVVPEVAVFRQPQNGHRVRRGPSSRPAADAHFGNRSSLFQAAPEPPGSRPSDLPVSVARRSDRAAQPRLEHRYYLHSDAWRLSVPGRGGGLVQPLRTQLGTLHHHGNGLLPGRARCRVPFRPTRNLELRSRLAVHLGRLPGSAQAARHLDQHGWPRPRARQRFHRTAVALAQVRADLSRRFRLRPRSVSRAGKLLPLLQPPAPAPGARLSDAGRSVPAQTQKEEIILMMGAPPPNLRDLSLLLSRMDAFRFTRNGACRTIEMLDRRTGQRRDATRAPIQARNGWAAHGRLLGQQPAALSKDYRFFVQTTRTTSRLESTYGGIGGGFHTLTMTMNLPTGAVASGTNTVS